MLAEVMFSCGRSYLSVADITVAMEGDKCRDSSIPEEYLEPIPPEELEHATIGDKSAKDLPIDIVRWFRGYYWSKAMLQYVADQINEKATSL